MNSQKLESSTSSLIEKQRKKINSVKLEMKGLFLRNDFQNITMLSTQELTYLDNFCSGEELVKMCMKKMKCKRFLAGTRKLKTFWEGTHNSRFSEKKLKKEEVFLLFYYFYIRQ